jgi:homoaconitate hydratase family protein
VTIAQKILARASGRKHVAPGEVVEVQPDFSYAHDYGLFAVEAFERMGATQVRRPERVAVCLDHAVPADNARDANNHARLRAFARKHGFAAFFEGGSGISHQVLMEQGYVLPGSLVVANDSHTPSGGAAGALAIGTGETEIGFLWATGRLWLKVPESVKVVLVGKLGNGVYAKDLMLHMIAGMGITGAQYQVLEFAGPALASLSMSERFTLANMSAEVGAKSAIFPADAVTAAFLAGRSRFEFSAVTPDETYSKDIEIDLDMVQPMVALPGREDRGVPVSQAAGKRITQVFIGSCTNARADDLAIAARILRGQRVHPDVRLIVVPASRQVMLQTARNGDLAALIEAGATLMPSGCAVCAGAHQGVLADGDVCLSTSNRNMAGRMGNRNAEILLCSPATAAASAITGAVTDARSFS